MLDLLLRVLVTAAGIALPTLLAHVPLPGWNEPELAQDGTIVAATHSIVAIGLQAVLLSFVLVEIVAALVPRWRPLRDGAGRVTLMRVTFVVAAALVTAQACYLAWSARGWMPELFEPGLGPLLLDALALALGTLALLVGARMVSRWGTGHGLSVVVVLGSLPDWLQRAELTASSGGGDPEMFARTLVITTLATLVLVGREVRGERVPVAGLVPLLAPGWVLELLWFASAFVTLEPLQFLFSPSYEAIAAVVVVSSLVLGWLWQRDRSLATLSARVPVLALSAVMCAAVAIGDRSLGLDASFIGTGYGLAFFVLAVACAHDVLREASLRLRVELVPILAFSDIAVVDRVGARLAHADIVHVMRGIGHRSLLRFFGPWVPVKLLVDRSRAEEASRIARAEANREAYEEITRAF